MCYMTSYVINKCFTPASITKEEGLYLPEPTGMNSPVASNMYFDWAKLQPRSAFFLDSSLCPESLPGTLHTRLDLRHPIPKLTRCSGQIVMSWIFSGVWKQPLRARISSISVSQPLNWSCFLGARYILWAWYQGYDFTRRSLWLWISPAFSTDQKWEGTRHRSIL